MRTLLTLAMVALLMTGARAQMTGEWLRDSLNTGSDVCLKMGDLVTVLTDGQSDDESLEARIAAAVKARLRSARIHGPPDASGWHDAQRFGVLVIGVGTARSITAALFRWQTNPINSKLGPVILWQDLYVSNDDDDGQLRSVAVEMTKAFIVDYLAANPQC